MLKSGRFRGIGPLVGVHMEVMERTELIAQIATASSPNDMASAMSAARYWLADHPDDEAMREAIEKLCRAERERRR